MGRPTNAEVAEREEPVAEVAVTPGRLPTITYSPEGEGAPYETIWNKHRFRANVPVNVRDVPGQYSGAQMVEIARKNPHFVVAGFDKAIAVSGIPDSPERYRSYAVGWIRMANSSDAMLKRWKNEKELREDCGAGPDDEEYLQTIFNPRLAILKESEKLAGAAVND
jgi:hypothetical protein